MNVRNAVILHGTQGSPDGNWFPWLDDQMQAKGFTVWRPQLPHAEQPSLHQWVEFVHQNAPFELDEHTIIIGHSSGAVLALALVQEASKPVGAVVGVAAFAAQVGNSVATNWEANARLFDIVLDWRVIQMNVLQQIVLLHSDDDPYVPLVHAKYLTAQLGAELTVVPGQGHFNLEKSSSYTQNWYLLRILKTWGYMAGSLVQVVDESDKPLYSVTKHELWAKGLRHRIVRVMVQDERGSVLLQRRQPYLFPYPDCWDTSAAGHVDADEDYETAAARELAEEVGLKQLELSPVQSYASDTQYQGAHFKRFNTLYSARVSSTTYLQLNEREVQEARWFSQAELHELARNHPEQMSDGLASAYDIMYRS